MSASEQFFGNLGLILCIGLAVILVHEFITAAIDDARRTREIRKKRELAPQASATGDLPFFKEQYEKISGEAIQVIVDSADINRTIAKKVIIAYADPRYKDKVTLHSHIESIKTMLIQTYGAIGAIHRFGFIIELYKQLQLINEEEAENYNRTLAADVVNQTEKMTD